MNWILNITSSTPVDRDPNIVRIFQILVNQKGSPTPRVCGMVLPFLWQLTSYQITGRQHRPNLERCSHLHLNGHQVLRYKHRCLDVRREGL